MDITDPKFIQKLEALKQLDQFNQYVTNEYYTQNDDAYILWKDHLGRAEKEQDFDKASALQKKAFSVFQVVEDIDDKVMQDFISFIRLMHF